jgi:hypothetical protein
MPSWLFETVLQFGEVSEVDVVVAVAVAGFVPGAGSYRSAGSRHGGCEEHVVVEVDDTVSIKIAVPE